MRRDLPHIASLAFNTPLFLEPAYARVFFCALAKQLGMAQVIDALTGIAVVEDDIASRLLNGEMGQAKPENPTVKSYLVINGIAVLPVSGTLVNKTRGLQPYSGMTGYNGIVARLSQAIHDPEVDGILLEMDTPGGMVSGAFDCAEMIARYRLQKPIWSLANDMHCSAGQLIASASEYRLVTQTSRVGSIGALVAHSDHSGELAKKGVDVTLIYSGAHKVDGHPYGALPESVRQDTQRRLDMLRQQFAEKVALYTGRGVEQVLATEAAVYQGQDAIEAGLVDEVINHNDAIGRMREVLDNSNKTSVGGRMTNSVKQEDAAQASVEILGEISVSAEGEAVTSVNTDLTAQAVSAERERILGILGCEEAKGREVQAHVLAAMPVMTIEQARGILAAAPQSAQFRSETALDTLMANEGAPLSAGDSAAADPNDMNALLDKAVTRGNTYVD